MPPSAARWYGAPAFTRGLAKELAKENIRVNGVALGVIVTPLHVGLSQRE